MDYAGFLTTVEREAGISREEAERAARATLSTLGQRLSSGEARDVASELPDELRPSLLTDSLPNPSTSTSSSAAWRRTRASSPRRPSAMPAPSSPRSARP